MTHKRTTDLIPGTTITKLQRIIRTTAGLVLLATTVSGCDSYWWTRGQPPATGELVQKAALAFDEQLKVSESARPDIAAAAKNAKAALLQLASSARSSRGDGAAFDVVAQSLAPLENSLSMGSRPALAELTGQFRVFAQQAHAGQDLNAPAVETLVSRALFLLASELSVPAPTFL